MIQVHCDACGADVSDGGYNQVSWPRAVVTEVEAEGKEENLPPTGRVDGAGKKFELCRACTRATLVASYSRVYQIMKEHKK